MVVLLMFVLMSNPDLLVWDLKKHMYSLIRRRMIKQPILHVTF